MNRKARAGEVGERATFGAGSLLLNDDQLAFSAKG
jgi:hypothetical protein